MGLEASIRAKCVPELGLQLVDSDGRRWGYWPANESGGVQAFTSEVEIMRGDLCQILHDGAKDKVRYKFGTSIARYTDTHTNGQGGPVRVEFTDSTAENYDLLVGADGLYSLTRKLMLSADPNPPNPLHALNQSIGYLKVPIAAEPGEEYNATAYIGTKGRCLLTRRNNPHELQVYLTSPNLTKRLQNIQDVPTQKQIFASEFRNAGWKAAEIVEQLLQSDDFYSQHEAYIRLNPWSCGHVTLLGDAGVCCSANGYGTSCAVVGAYILAGELVRHVVAKADGSCRSQNVQTALACYEKKLRPFVEVLQEGLDEEEDGSGGFQFKDWYIPVIQHLAWFASLFRVYKLAWLFSDRCPKGWKLPDYPELQIKSS
ncbi:Hypothetical protein R9X50_00309000 [Acrodontium crateriforme]|uniref:FAD-binding domain-containing protein n=1 Tax=Acrodontium crateriforme TaxID=150365 RepID=A0AAQ3M5J8_9PEZI|nr:Hypothetical protein R9X50_00309000 [Acrodontium crateriforme]